MKFKLFISIILILSFILVGCNSNITPVISESENKETTSITISSDIGGSEYIHCQSYHDFSGALIDFVGANKFDEWIKNTEEKQNTVKDEECIAPLQNIYQFIIDFNISKEEFTRLYYSDGSYYTRDYNINLLYSGDKEAIEAYYTSGGNTALFEHRIKIYEIKIMLIQNVPTEIYDQWSGKETAMYIENSNTRNCINWSIPEFLYYFNIDEEVFIGWMKNYASKYTSFINYDKIYRDNADIKAAIENKMMPYEIDELVCGDGAGFETLCKIHKTSYHDIIPELISFVGEENYAIWLVKTNQKDQDISSFDCKYPLRNIYQFLTDLAISKEDFTAVYNSSENRDQYDYNIDLLYGGDETAILAYYTE